MGLFCCCWGLFKFKITEIFVSSVKNDIKNKKILKTQKCSGEATKHDTTSHLVGIRFKEGGFMPCDDDEDLCDFGSGNGENSVFILNKSDSKLSDTCRLFSNFLCYLLKYNYN